MRAPARAYDLVTVVGGAPAIDGMPRPFLVPADNGKVSINMVVIQIKSAEGQAGALSQARARRLPERRLLVHIAVNPEQPEIAS